MKPPSPHTPSETTVASPSPVSLRSTEAPLGLLWVFPLSAGRVTLSTKPTQMIGRGEDCDVQLQGAELSRRHALLLRDGLRWIVRDLGSKNGVHVNGDRVTEHALQGGDVVRVGDSVGVVRNVWWQPEASPSLCRPLAEQLLGGPQLEQALSGARATASSDLPIVVEGETGTGKECTARAIHEWSGRAGPFVGVNCAALPESLAESELFGHKKGAFTGAEHNRVGYLQAAHGGTLLLDEVTDLPLSIQAKLLRALELRQVVPLGESAPVSIDVRLVTASQESLRRAVEEKRFRADLYARLAGLVVCLPPLRERTEEVPDLFTRRLARHCQGPAPALDRLLVEALCLHDWPFNVRELDLLARRLAAMHAGGPALERSHLPPEMRARRGPRPGPGVPGLPAQFAPAAPNEPQAAWDPAALPRQASPRVEDFQQMVETRRNEEREALLVALRAEGGNVARAARRVGISRQRAYRLMDGSAEFEAGKAAAPPDTDNAKS
ncbi:MAG: sigma 54-interacting transcriptional regulator [Polyangiaceae bacterium]|nr:sigma 54-interacting transcriptional regulator [Polyangiaceae bacterium]